MAAGWVDDGNTGGWTAVRPRYVAAREACSARGAVPDGVADAIARDVRGGMDQ